MIKRYDYINKRAKCECIIKINFMLITEIPIDKNKLYDNFINLSKMTNLWVFKCYHVLFSKNAIINNIGVYALIPIIILQIILITVFYIKVFPAIKNVSNWIIDDKNNFKTLNKNSEELNNKKDKAVKKDKINIEKEKNNLKGKKK